MCWLPPPPSPCMAWIVQVTRRGRSLGSYIGVSHPAPTAVYPLPMEAVEHWRVRALQPESVSSSGAGGSADGSGGSGGGGFAVGPGGLPLSRGVSVGVGRFPFSSHTGAVADLSSPLRPVDGAVTDARLLFGSSQSQRVHEVQAASGHVERASTKLVHEEAGLVDDPELGPDRLGTLWQEAGIPIPQPYAPLPLARAVMEQQAAAGAGAAGGSMDAAWNPPSVPFRETAPYLLKQQQQLALLQQQQQLLLQQQQQQLQQQQAAAAAQQYARAGAGGGAGGGAGAAGAGGAGFAGGTPTAAPAGRASSAGGGGARGGLATLVPAPGGTSSNILKLPSTLLAQGMALDGGAAAGAGAGGSATPGGAGEGDASTPAAAGQVSKAGRVRKKSAHAEEAAAAAAADVPSSPLLSPSATGGQVSSGKGV